MTLHKDKRQRVAQFGMVWSSQLLNIHAKQLDSILIFYHGCQKQQNVQSEINAFAANGTINDQYAVGT